MIVFFTTYWKGKKIQFVLTPMLLQKLYNLGVTRVLVTGTGPMGCVPAELAQRSRNGQCDAELQRAAGLFNPQLTQMLQNLNRKIGRNVFIAANTELMHNDFISNPGAYGKQIILFSNFIFWGKIYTFYWLNFPWFGRICYLEGSMLWSRSIQRARAMHTVVQLMPQQRPVCFLGSIPSIWKG